MNILYADEYVTFVTVPLVRGPNNLYLKGRYVRRYDGRWYQFELEWGRLTRVKYISQIKKLNRLFAVAFYKEVVDGEKS
jgi:hypothetical protein